MSKKAAEEVPPEAAEVRPEAAEAALPEAEEAMASDAYKRFGYYLIHIFIGGKESGS